MANSTAKVTNKDPSIQAILNKRTPFIENIYTKNLKQQHNLDKQYANESSLSQLPLANSSMNFNSQQASASHMSMNRGYQSSAGPDTLMKEQTELSTTTFDFGTSEADNSEDARSFVNDQGATEYQHACYCLRIVPCSIILKSFKLSFIGLGNYGLGSVGTLALTSGLKFNTNVTSLDLSGNEIGPQGVKHLASLFSENTSIVDLDISRNFIGSEGIGPLIELFKNNKTLISIDISNNDFTDDDGVTLIQAIEDHPIQKLNLSNNKLGEKSGIVAGHWLADNVHLLDINLAWNHFRKKGAIAVARGISENNKLKTVHLEWNGFGNEGADALGSALKHNVMLEELDVRCNRIGDRGFLSLCVGLSDNTTLKRLYVGENSINDEALKAGLKHFITISSLGLELLDLTGNTTVINKKKAADNENLKTYVEEVKKLHPKFKCLHVFNDINLGKRRIISKGEEVCFYVKDYCSKNSINLAGVFQRPDTEKITTITPTELKSGLRRIRLPITGSQLEALIEYLDQDGDGEINLSDLSDDQNMS